MDPDPLTPEQQVQQMHQAIAQAQTDAAAARARVEDSEATQQQKYEQLVAEMKAEFTASRSSGARSLFGNAKLLQPKRFSGDKRQTRETLHTWLFTFEEFMNLQNLPKELWSRMAGQHLEGAAQLWYETRSKELPVADLLNWDRFVSDINGLFAPINSNDKARDMLRTLSQKGSVQNYCADFDAIRLQIDNMAELEAMDRFISQLKPHVTLEVRMRKPETLRKAMEIAEEFDSLSFSGQRTGWATAPSRRNSSYQPMQAAWAPQASYSGPMAMEVGAMAMHGGGRNQMGGGQRQYSPAQRAQRQFMAEGFACSFCKRPGHNVNNCPNRARRNPPIASQGNRFPSQGNGRTGRH